MSERAERWKFIARAPIERWAINHKPRQWRKFCISNKNRKWKSASNRIVFCRAGEDAKLCAIRLPQTVGRSAFLYLLAFVDSYRTWNSARRGVAAVAPAGQHLTEHCRLSCDLRPAPPVGRTQIEWNTFRAHKPEAPRHFTFDTRETSKYSFVALLCGQLAN